MRAVAETAGLGDVQETHERARRETLPSYYMGGGAGRARAWMEVERYLALNPGATVARACQRLGIEREVYEAGKAALVAHTR